MRKIICLVGVIFPLFLLLPEKNYIHRRVKKSIQYWQTLRQEAEKIDFQSLPVRELTIYYFRDEAFRKIDKWMTTGRMTSEEIPVLMTIAKTAGMNFQQVLEGLSGEGRFQALLDELAFKTVQKLTDLIAGGEERYSSVLRYVNFPTLPYLKRAYEQLLSDNSKEAMKRRKIILSQALLDGVSPPSQLADFLWQVLTSKNSSSQEKEFALGEIGHCGNWEMFTELLKNINSSENLGVSRETLDRTINIMAERLLEEHRFQTPSELASMIHRQGSVILRTREGEFIEVREFRSLWIPGLWLMEITQPSGAILLTWRKLKDNLAVLVDWSKVRNNLPGFEQ